jgi:hypothetical protein
MLASARVLERVAILAAHAVFNTLNNYYMIPIKNKKTEVHLRESTI